MADMRAFGFSEHGGPERSTLLSVPCPEPGPGEVRVQVEAVALNHLDIFVRQGWPGLKLELPHWSGSDIAGAVESVGPGVDASLEGADVVVDPVLHCGTCRHCARDEPTICTSFHLIGEHVRGGLAEQVCVPAANVVPRPVGMDPVEAAAVPVTFMTAWRALVGRAGITDDDTVVVLGAGGGLASAAIQVAKLRGARVLATTSNGDKVARAKALGADEVLDYTLEPNWHRWVLGHTDGRGADVVLDSVGGATWVRSLKAVARGGTVLVPGTTTGDASAAGLPYVFWKQVRIIGSTMGSRSDLQVALQHVAARRLAPTIDATFPLKGAPEAFAKLEQGAQFGKIVVLPLA